MSAYELDVLRRHLRRIDTKLAEHGILLANLLEKETQIMSRLDPISAVLDALTAKVEETKVTLQELVALAADAVTPEQIAAVRSKAQGILDNLTAAETAADPTPDGPPPEPPPPA